MDTSLKAIFLLQITFGLVFCTSHIHQSNIHHAVNAGEDASYFFYQHPAYPRDCEEARQHCSSSQNVSGIYFIKPDGFPEAFEVFCDYSNDSGGWMLVQRRIDGSLGFNREWNEYKEGFGFLNGEFWIGYEKLSFILNQKKYELRIQLVTSKVSSWYINYNDFRISDVWGNYSLVRVGMYSGNADSHVTWCPTNMKYGNCTCQATCEDPNNENGCHNTCTREEACVCPKGFVMNGNNCVLKKDCDCFVQGVGLIQNGQTHTNSNCSRKCSCNRNQLTCENLQCSMDATCVELDGAFQCLCNDGFVRDGQNCIRAADCQMLFESGLTINGVYTVKPSGWSGSAFKVYCEMESNGGGWTVFQRRVNGTVDFYRNWTSYKEGFGSLTHEFWLGNDKIHALTTQRSYQLRVDAVNSQGNSIYNLYSTFRISNESNKYRLSLGSKSGNTGGNAMHYNNGKQFSTHDQDNDGGNRYNCAEKHRGAWWYKDYISNNVDFCGSWNIGSGTYRYHTCSRSNLNGDYQQSGAEGQFFWDKLTNQHCGITKSEMKLR